MKNKKEKLKEKLEGSEEVREILSTVECNEEIEEEEEDFVKQCPVCKIDIILLPEELETECTVCGAKVYRLDNPEDLK